MEFENNYELTEKDKERVGKDITKLVSRELTVGEYRSMVMGTLNNKNKTYMHYFANREQAIACEVLHSCGLCSKYVDCKGCPLEDAWRNAREEIYRRQRVKTYKSKGCRTDIWVGKDGIIYITQTM